MMHFSAKWSAIVCLCIFSSSLSVAVEAQVCTCKGDVSGPAAVPDGTIGIPDLSSVLGMLSAAGCLFGEIPNNPCLDIVDRDIFDPSEPTDGQINIYDFQAFFNYFASLSPPVLSGPCMNASIPHESPANFQFDLLVNGSPDWTVLSEGDEVDIYLSADKTVRYGMMETQVQVCGGDLLAFDHTSVGTNGLAQVVDCRREAVQISPSHIEVAYSGLNITPNQNWTAPLDIWHLKIRMSNSCHLSITPTHGLWDGANYGQVPTVTYMVSSNCFMDCDLYGGDFKVDMRDFARFRNHFVTPFPEVQCSLGEFFSLWLDDSLTFINDCGN